jgi:hypothetical protein
LIKAGNILSDPLLCCCSFFFESSLETDSYCSSAALADWQTILPSVSRVSQTTGLSCFSDTFSTSGIGFDLAKSLVTFAASTGSAALAGITVSIGVTVLTGVGSDLLML